MGRMGDKQADIQTSRRTGRWTEDQTGNRQTGNRQGRQATDMQRTDRQTEGLSRQNANRARVGHTHKTVSHSASEAAVCYGAHRGRQAACPEGSNLLHMPCCLLSPALHPCNAPMPLCIWQSNWIPVCICQLNWIPWCISQLNWSRIQLREAHATLGLYY